MQAVRGRQFTVRIAVQEQSSCSHPFGRAEGVRRLEILWTIYVLHDNKINKLDEWVRESERKRPLGKLNADGRIIWKWFLEK
jgi:hypothetical protein